MMIIFYDVFIFFLNQILMIMRTGTTHSASSDPSVAGVIDLPDLALTMINNNSTLTTRYIPYTRYHSSAASKCSCT